MKKAFKITFILTFVLILAVAFSACGSRTITRPGMTGNAVEVTGTCAISKTAGGVTVSAETNLVDGTKGRVSVGTPEGKVLAKQAVEIKDGKASYEFAIGEDWGTEVVGFFVASPSQDGEQTEAVYGVYGSKFENMQGEYVIWDSSSVMMAINSAEIDLSK